MPILEEGDIRLLRSRYGELIDGLVAAGAKAILFDLLFFSESVHVQELAEAMARADQAGVPVALAMAFEARRAVLPVSALRTAARVGHIEMETDHVHREVRRVPVRKRSTDGETFWCAAVDLVRAYWNAMPPEVGAHEHSIGGISNPALVTDAATPQQRQREVAGEG